MQSFRIVPSIEGLDYFNAETQSRREAQNSGVKKIENIAALLRGL